MRFDVVSVLPGMFSALAEYGVSSRALARGIARMTLWNPRDYTSDVHRTVDDRPYGGGPGMLMKPEPLQAAIEAAKRAAPGSLVAYLSPQGRRLTQERIREIARERAGMILVCGRYEGIDERISDLLVDEEWSLGDYVLSGGELAAMALMDAVIRMLPGALGHADSAEQDSHMAGLLDCPHYTRPEEFAGQRVPEVLLGGNHEVIRRWRLKQSLGRTWSRRPDLLQARSLTQEERDLLEEFIRAHLDA